MRVLILVGVFYSLLLAQIEDSIPSDSSNTTLQSKSLTDSVSVKKDSTATIKNNEVVSIAKNISIETLKPLTFDTTGAGSLRVDVYPKDTKVFLNGVYVGDGTRNIVNLKSGMYELFLQSKRDNAKDFIHIQNGLISNAEFTLGKTTRFSIEHSYAYFISSNAIASGPSLDLGLIHKNNYYGIDYSWLFYSTTGHDEVFGGAAFKYRHILSAKDICTFEPGFFAGFWYASSYSYNSDDKFYLFGITSKCTVGTEFVAFHVEPELLIGNAAAFQLKMGITLNL